VPDGTDARRPTSLARVGIALLGGLLVTLVAAQVGLWWNGVDGPATASDTANAPAAQQSAPPSWPDVITALDAARARALATADPALLGEVYVEASAAGVTDAATIGQLAEQGWRVVGGVHQIVSVTVDSPNDSPNDSPVGGPGESAAAGPASPGPVRLAVVDTLASHPIVDADGRQVGLTPARAEQRRIFVMVLTGNGYRISAVEPG